MKLEGTKLWHCVINWNEGLESCLRWVADNDLLTSENATGVCEGP